MPSYFPLLFATFLAASAFSAGSDAQGLASSSPAKEFVYSGGRLAAVVSLDNSAAALPGSAVANIPFTSFAGGQALDVSGNGNHLTLGLTTAAETEDPAPLAGKGVEFVSTENDQLTFGAPSVGGVNFFPAAANSFSVAVAIKRALASPPANQGLLDAGHFHFRMNGNGANAKILGGMRAQPFDSGNFDQSQTVIYVLRWNGSNLKTRINDAGEVTASSGGAAASSVNILVGKRQAAGTSLSTGSRFYHLVVWNGALTDAEMTEAFLHLCGQLQGSGVATPSACP